MDNVSLVCFDLNGTLITGNPWYELNLAMGMTHDEDDELLKLHRGGHISYEEGQRRIEKYYLRSGRAKKNFIVEKLSTYRFMEHARDTIRYLQAKKYELAIITGSIDLLALQVAEELNITHWAANNRFLFDTSGSLTHIDTQGDRASFKVAELKKLCERLGIDHHQCVCVGDSLTDFGVFALSGHGIGFVGSQASSFAWRTIHDLSDLKKIL